MLAVCRKSRVDLTMLRHLAAPGRLVLERGGSIDNKHRRSSTISSSVSAASSLKIHFQPLIGRWWSAAILFLHCCTACTQSTNRRRIMYVTNTELHNRILSYMLLRCFTAHKLLLLPTCCHFHYQLQILSVTYYNNHHLED